MKSDKDIRDEVLQGMCKSGTLSGNPPYIPDDVNIEEVRAAFFERYAEKMNEELKEPYGRARIWGAETESVKNECVDRFANLINSACQDLFLQPYPYEELKEHLYSRLIERYKL